MVRVVIDAELRSKLQGLREPVELVDEGGSVLGVIKASIPRFPEGWWEPPIEDYERPPFAGQRFYTVEEVRAKLQD